MTQQPTLRQHDQPIHIGPRHGYRIEGDHAFINAELQVPPYHSGGAWTLELWAAHQPYVEGPLTGLKVAQVALELPTPIGPHVHQVDARTAARWPLQGPAYAMVLALIQHAPDGQTKVHAFANYARPQTFNAPQFSGNVSYGVHGSEVVLEADALFNPRTPDNLSGTLSVELWAFAESGPATEGLRLAAAEIGQISGQSRLSAIERRVAFVEPPVGRFRLALLLCEWTLAHGYVARDRRDFATIYERVAPEPAAPDALAAPPRTLDKLRLVSTAEAPSLVSIQTASVEELAVVKGLNLKLAKEIIKARPFTSLADLIRVRGLGEKTIDRLKGLLTL
jgi:Helix-hairpin-helix motif